MEGDMVEPEKRSPEAIGSEAAAELAWLREQIDAVDRSLLEKLNERARLVQSVGRLKAGTGSPVYEPARERQIVEQLTAANPGPFPSRGIAPVFREIVSATRSLERVLRVGFFGPEGTFTHQAARRQFGELAGLESLASIPEVFAAVERDRIDLGVVPVENTTEGVVTQTLDALAEHEVAICGEVVLRISQQLLSRSGRLEDVRQVVSHPQPIAQCRLWLDRHLPGVERVEAASTASAAQRAAADGSVAAIGSAIAGEVYGLRTIEPSIEDRRDNTTRFAVIGKQSPPPSGNDLTSVLFTIRKDEAGALHRLLAPFAEQGLNLTSIQLRPIKGKPWEYLFFLDVEGHRSDPRLIRALEGAARVAHTQRVLGSFPRAESPRAGRAGQGD
jgi:chorismate mutase/prephenate dehydratase